MFVCNCTHMFAPGAVGGLGAAPDLVLCYPNLHHVRYNTFASPAWLHESSDQAGHTLTPWRSCGLWFDVSLAPKP